MGWGSTVCSAPYIRWSHGQAASKPAPEAGLKAWIGRCVTICDASVTRTIRLRYHGSGLLSQCAGLLEVSQAHVKGSKRVCRRFTITLQGWAAVAELRPGYRPARLTTEELKAAVAALQQERDQWALSLLRDAVDAMRWRRHESEVKDKKRKCKLRTLRKPRSSSPIVNAIPGTQVSAHVPASIASNSRFGFGTAPVQRLPQSYHRTAFANDAT